MASGRGPLRRVHIPYEQSESANSSIEIAITRISYPNLKFHLRLAAHRVKCTPFDHPNT
jgi:hypothetical protein